MIDVAGLRKSYAGRAILDSVSIAVRPGEIVALLGPNGAGKTTLVETIEGYRMPDAGTVRVLGQDPRRGGPGLRARVGLMLQDGAGLEPRATPRDLVHLFAAFHAGGRPADELIELVGLGGAAATRVRSLSGGERQRLALAIALVGEPEVLLLDEPTSGMDPQARRDTRELIASLRDAGRTILLTTHDLADVERLADRVAILHRGRIVADAPLDALAGGGPGPHPTGASGAAASGPAAGVRFRLHAVPTADAVAALRSRLATIRPATTLRAVAGHDGDAALAYEIEPGAASADVVLELAQWAARQGLLITDLRAGAASLEERYLELTGDHDVEDVA
jgi:ABC-2 type transport system ATP-binding protein